MKKNTKISKLEKYNSLKAYLDKINDYIIACQSLIDDINESSK